MNIKRVGEYNKEGLARCGDYKALIHAMAMDDRPLICSRASRLLASGWTPVALITDCQSALQTCKYSPVQYALGTLCALQVAPNQILHALNQEGFLTATDTVKRRINVDVPLCPNVPPSEALIKARLSALENHPAPIVWDYLCDEIAIQPMVAVTSKEVATGLCATCCKEHISVTDQVSLDSVAGRLEADDDCVHLGQLATVWSFATHMTMMRTGRSHCG